MKLTKTRREYVTKGADPTVAVEWTVTNENANEKLRTQEFQDVISAWWVVEGGTVKINEMMARLIHDGLEAEHALNERIKAENEFDCEVCNDTKQIWGGLHHPDMIECPHCKK